MASAAGVPLAASTAVSEDEAEGEAEGEAAGEGVPVGSAVAAVAAASVLVCTSGLASGSMALSTDSDSSPSGHA